MAEVGSWTGEGKKERRLEDEKLRRYGLAAFGGMKERRLEGEKVGEDERGKPKDEGRGKMEAVKDRSLEDKKISPPH